MTRDLACRWQLRLPMTLVLAFLVVACGSSEQGLPGDRLPVRPVTFPIPNEDLTSIQLSKAVANGDWTHLNGTTSHFAGHVDGTYPLRPIWRASIGEGDSKEGNITSGAIIAGGRVFTMDSIGVVSAFTTDGALLWRQNLARSEEHRFDGFGGGLSFGRGVLVAGTGFGDIFALSPETGGVIWRQELDAPVRAAPTVFGDDVFAVARNDQAFSIGLDDGRIQWRATGVEPGAGFAGGASPAAREGLVVIPFGSGEVVGALVRNGRRAWTAFLSGGQRGLARGQFADVTGDPVITRDRVFVANQSGRFVALDRESGAQLWSVNDGSLGPALPIDNSVFFITDSGVLKRLNAETGTEIWTTALPEFARPEIRRDAYFHAGPVLVGGRLLVVSSDGFLRTFDPQSGAELSRLAIGDDGAAAQPAVAGGRVYIVTRAGTLVAFE